MIFTCFSAKWRIIDFMIYFNLAKCKYVLKMKAENLWGEYQNCVKGQKIYLGDYAMKIKSISIENFRSIKNATINFNEITALVEKIMLGKQPFLEL